MGHALGELSAADRGQLEREVRLEMRGVLLHAAAEAEARRAKHRAPVVEPERAAREQATTADRDAQPAEGLPGEPRLAE